MRRLAIAGKWDDAIAMANQVSGGGTPEEIVRRVDPFVLEAILDTYSTCGHHEAAIALGDAYLVRLREESLRFGEKKFSPQDMSTGSGDFLQLTQRCSV